MSTCEYCTYCSALVNNRSVETRRLLFLRELARLGSMREVAEELAVTTSTVSQQIAALADDLGTPLIEPEGRRVRLTPVGRRVAEHAVTILAAVDAARLDLDPDAEPAGSLRVAGFATAIRRSLLPIFGDLRSRHPQLQMLIHEHEPAEALALLADDGVDLALVYDYNLAPVSFDRAVDAVPMWTADWGLGVPTNDGHRSNDRPTDDQQADDALAIFGRFRSHDWIVNSRNTADEIVVRTISSMAGFEPNIVHHADSLDLVVDLITAGLGVGLLPAAQPPAPGVRLLELTGPPVVLRAFAVSRRGQSVWPPLALVRDRVSRPAGAGARRG